MEEQLIRPIEEARLRTTQRDHPGAAEGSRKSGPLTARERIEQLIDVDTFVEYGALAGATTQPDDEAWADALVAGVGLVAGAPVVIASL